MAKLAKGRTARPAKSTTLSVGSPSTSSKKAGEKTKDKEAPSQVAAAPKKEVSQKLIETIEKRKKSKGMFGKPPGRRGRRPKNASEYTPMNQEEDGYVLESDYEGIEYDTGIRVKDGGGATTDGFAVDRFDDFEVEELNFD